VTSAPFIILVLVAAWFVGKFFAQVFDQLAPAFLFMGGFLFCTIIGLFSNMLLWVWGMLVNANIRRKENALEEASKRAR
jgi:hypothetical protein